MLYLATDLFPNTSNISPRIGILEELLLDFFPSPAAGASSPWRRDPLEDSWYSWYFWGDGAWTEEPPTPQEKWLFHSGPCNVLTKETEQGGFSFSIPSTLAQLLGYPAKKSQPGSRHLALFLPSSKYHSSIKPRNTGRCGGREGGK